MISMKIDDLKDCFHVIEGGVDTTVDLLKVNFVSIIIFQVCGLGEVRLHLLHWERGSREEDQRGC